MTSLQVTRRERALEDALALAGGSSRTIAGSLAPDVRAWVASPEQGLGAVVESVSGAKETTDSRLQSQPN
jgi:hypothetical protein